jgi:hypothetical protein
MLDSSFKSILHLKVLCGTIGFRMVNVFFSSNLLEGFELASGILHVTKFGIISNYTPKPLFLN